jgi:hypothetical protein
VTKRYLITVVDRIDKPWPPSKQLVETGVPLKVAREYDVIRRRMSPRGLKRWAKENMN